MSDYPVVNLEGSDPWRHAYEFGNALDERFPDQDAHDFAQAIGENSVGPIVEGVGVTGLLMLKQGERDEGDWVWVVTLTNGETWFMSGWCDYTGWDCRSANEWVQA